MNTIPYQIKDSGKDFIRIVFFYKNNIFSRTITFQESSADEDDSTIFKFLQNQAKKYIELLQAAMPSAARTLLLSAEVTPWENVNCQNCTDCNGCVNCQNCTKCFGCKNCENCERCFDCSDCQNCISCKKSEVCRNCVKCVDCFNCKYSQNLKRCKNCTECYDCLHCSSCKTCVNCSDLVHRTSCDFVLGDSSLNEYLGMFF